MRARWLRLAAAFIAIYTAPDRAAAQDESAFFRGKTVALYIGTGPGGGYDTYGRMVARHLGKALPGNPNVVPQNMPGASSLVLSNFLYGRAPRDGTALGIINQAMPIEQRLGMPNVAYDAAKFSWIGRVTSAVELNIVWHTVPVRTFEDLRKRETLVGGTGPTSSTVFMPWLLNNLTGTRFKVVTGFNGTSEIGIAMERGEVEGSATPIESLESYRAHWVREGKIRILIQYAVNRHPKLPDIPTLVELGPTEEARAVLKLYALGGEFGRSVVAPPEIPAQRVSSLRRSFDAMLKDAEFVSDTKRAGLEINPATGEQLQALVEEIAAMPETLIERARVARQPPK